MQRVFSAFGSRHNALFHTLFIKRLLVRAAGALVVSEVLAYVLALPPLWRSLVSDVVGLLLFAFTLPPLFKPVLDTLRWLEASEAQGSTNNHPHRDSTASNAANIDAANTDTANIDAANTDSDTKHAQTQLIQTQLIQTQPIQQDELIRLTQYSRQLARQLEQAQQRFDRLFHNLYDGAVHFDENGVCIAVNKPRYFDFAFPLQHLRGKTLQSYYGALGKRHEHYRQRALELAEAQVYRHDLTIDGTAYYREYRTFTLDANSNPNASDLDANNLDASNLDANNLDANNLEANNNRAETIILVRDISKEHNVIQQLRASEKRFRTFFEKSPLPCLLLDMQTSSDNNQAYDTDEAGIRFHVLVNDAFETFLGYNPWTDSYYDYATAFAQYQSYSHPEDFAREVHYIEGIMQSHRHNYQMEKRFYAADGSLRWGDLHSNVITRYDGGLSLIMFTVSDITEQKRAQLHLETSLLQLQQSEIRFRAFFEQNASPCTITIPLTSASSADANTETAKTDDSLLYIMANDAFVAFLGENPWAQGTHNYEEALAINRHYTHPDDYDLETKYIQEVQQGQRDSYRLEKRFFHQDGNVRWGDVQTVVLHDGADHFTMSLTTIQDITATKQAQRDLKGALSQLEQAYEDAMRVVGLMLEYRDYETKGHTDRVTQIALKLADALHLPANERYALKRGAYLHDIGKIAIPDAILRKPSTLTDSEWRLMQAHTTIGYGFVNQLSFLPQGSKDVVRYHHEKYAGGGYPDGLSGEDIPLLARIFALADVYDALTSQRAYKEAWQHEHALEEIRKQAGNHFDPELVAVFVALFEHMTEAVS